MTIREALRMGTEMLSPVPDPRIDAEHLLGSVMGMRRLELSLNATRALTAAQEEAFLGALYLRAGRQPLQYILGIQSFYGCDLLVDESVLIPRPETETLCEKALACMKGRQAPLVADICTGSGAIAIAIKTNRPDAKVYATELSDAAFHKAMDNAKRNAAEIAFLQGDLLAPLQGQRFDLIVSNPPYIKTAELATLQPEVRREPRMALDGGDDGLTFYRRLAEETPHYLKHGGTILLELGDGQAEAAADIFTQTQQFEAIAVSLDLFGKQRVLEASYP